MNVKFDTISHSQFFYKKSFLNAKFFLFEPTKSLNVYLEKIKKEKKDLCEIEIINKAVWIEYGFTNFYECNDPRWNTEDRDPSIANAIFINENISVDVNNPLTIETINFSKWIVDHINPNDYLIVKMDIEGGEIEVIKDLIKNNLLNTHINEIYIGCMIHQE